MTTTVTITLPGLTAQEAEHLVNRVLREWRAACVMREGFSDRQRRVREAQRAKLGLTELEMKALLACTVSAQSN